MIEVGTYRKASEHG